jgi:hypothetical protein
MDGSQQPGSYLHNADCVMRASNPTPESGLEMKDKSVSHMTIPRMCWLILAARLANIPFWECGCVRFKLTVSDPVR